MPDVAGFINRTEGRSPHGIDLWSKVYRTRHTAAGEAHRLLERHAKSTYRPSDWTVTTYRIDDTDAGPQLVLVEVVRPDA